MMNGHINNEHDNTDPKDETVQDQIAASHSTETFDPLTSPIIKLKNEIGALPFLGAILTIMIISYLIILSTELKDQLGNSFGYFIGAAGISTIMIWGAGWLIIMKNKQGFSDQGMFLQTIGICVSVAFLIILGSAIGGLGVLAGALILVVAFFIIKGQSAEIRNEQDHLMPENGNPDAPAKVLIQNIMKQMNNATEDAPLSAFKKMFLSKKQLAEDMKASVELKKQKVRYAYYTSEQVKMTAKSLGYMIEMDTIFSEVYKELFGVEYNGNGDTSFNGYFDAFSRMRNPENDHHEEG